MKATSIKGKSAKEIENALEANGIPGFHPTLAVVFTSNDGEREAVCQVLSRRNIRVFGSSSGSEFIDSEIETDSIVILFLTINTECFYLDLKEYSAGNVKDTAQQIGHAGLSKFKKPAFMVVSGGLSVDGDEIVEGIESACGKGTTIFGGLAADKLLMERTYVFTNDKLTDNGLLALIVDEEKISINGVAIGAWKPVGVERTITRSIGNVVYTIDDEPALDFMSRYAGLKDLNVNNAIDLVISSNFQLEVQRENKHSYMRTPMQANFNDRSIVFAGTMPEGSKVRLCLLPGFEVIEIALDGFKQYKNMQPEADALIMFSCAGRQMTLGPYLKEEIDGVKKIWNAPLVGFCCFGEIGRVSSGEHQFHNMTCSLAIFKEK